jgi:hypothetical protein
MPQNSDNGHFFLVKDTATRIADPLLDDLTALGEL